MLKTTGGIVTAVGFRLRLIFQHLAADLPVSDCESYIKVLFQLFGESMTVREFESEGWFKFRLGFESYYRQFSMADSVEKMDDFLCNFYDFIDVCFPMDMQEEVFYDA